ncbi:MAG TPA: 5-oxoprolinase subunit PxpB [Limnochordales bacterium]
MEAAGEGVRFRPAGDGALLVELGEGIDPVTHRRVMGLWRSLLERPVPGMAEAVPGYRSVLVTWDPEAADGRRIREEVARRVQGLAASRPVGGRRVAIPVVYGGPFGPDLEAVAARAGLAPDEVVRRHAAGRYIVYMLGFLPGFVYLGGLDPTLAMPRRPSPLPRVPAGSVAIGGSQTGIYGAGGAPGGWHVIGRTWVRLWDPGRRRPALLRPGDRVRFVPASAEQAPPGWAEAVLEAAPVRRAG